MAKELKRTYGIDVARYQTTQQVNDFVERMGRDKHVNIEFIICKASEGKNYQDYRFQQHVVNGQLKGMITGAYHYARPDLNKNPVVEVENFLNQVGDYYRDNSMLLALDWEDKAHNCDPNWALTWLQEVESRTGVKPLFYTQYSKVSQYEIIAEANFGLWVAKYGDAPSRVSGWQFPAMWQYTSTPLDQDVFYGSREQLLKYCTQGMGCACCKCCKRNCNG